MQHWGMFWSIVALLWFLASSYILGLLFVGKKPAPKPPGMKNPYCPFDFKYLSNDCGEQLCSDEEILACSRAYLYFGD